MGKDDVYSYKYLLKFLSSLLFTSKKTKEKKNLRPKLWRKAASLYSPIPPILLLMIKVLALKEFIQKQNYCKHKSGPHWPKFILFLISRDVFPKVISLSVVQYWSQSTEDNAEPFPTSRRAGICSIFVNIVRTFLCKMCFSLYTLVQKSCVS